MRQSSDDEMPSEEVVNGVLRRVTANRKARRKAKAPLQDQAPSTSSIRADAMAAAYGAECSSALADMDEDLQDPSFLFIALVLPGLIRVGCVACCRKSKTPWRLRSRGKRRLLYCIYPSDERTPKS